MTSTEQLTPGRPQPEDKTEDTLPRRRVDTHELSSDLRIAVGRLSRRLRAEKADGDLTDGQYSVLALLDREGPRTLTELSDHERVKPPSMNRTVNLLVEAGLVQRGTEPADGRKVILSVTTDGAAFAAETRRRRDRWLFRRLADLSPDERRTLGEAAAIMRKLADS